MIHTFPLCTFLPCPNVNARFSIELHSLNTDSMSKFRASTHSALWLICVIACDDHFSTRAFAVCAFHCRGHAISSRLESFRAFRLHFAIFHPLPFEVC